MDVSTYIVHVLLRYARHNMCIYTHIYMYLKLYAYVYVCSTSPSLGTVNHTSLKSPSIQFNPALVVVQTHLSVLENLVEFNPNEI